MELTKIQKEAVEKILGYYSPIEKVNVDFKAPTGSGKTLMASWIISLIIERNIKEKFVFVIATPSSSSLPFFFEQKLNVYKKDLPYSKFEVEYIESPSSSQADKTEANATIKVESNKVYIFGKSTFGKGRIFTERHIIDDFVDEVKNTGHKLIYIRDEAHIGDITRTDSETKMFEELMQNHSDFIIKMTATPNLSDSTVKFVQILESDINDGYKNENKWLLKTQPTLLLNDSMNEDALLENAILEFKKLKESYKTLEKDNIFIHPALLIQVSNEPSNTNDKKIFFDALDDVKKRLDYHGLSWVKYFGDSDKESNSVLKDKFTLDEITQIDHPTDVVLFKIGPSTGWDIPRACMLLQLRKVCSDKLNIQTIGRIKRNPYPNLAKNSVTDKYYIYSNTPKIDEDFTYYQYQVKEALIGEEFPVIEIMNKKDFRISVQKPSITKDLLKFIDDNKYILVQELQKYFVKDNGVDIFRKELYEVNGAMVYTSVSNPFIFLKDLKRLIDSRSNIYEYCNEAIEKSLKSVFKDVLLYQNVKLQIEHIQYILFHNHTTEIIGIIKKNSPFISKYKVSMVPYEPKQYVEVYDSVMGEGIIENSDNTYLFDVVKNNSTRNLQPLDSTNSEPVVFRFLSREINAINEYIGDKVRIWSKNLRNSSISGDYLDKTHTFHKSFFDFIIKFTNGNHLYIEVKGKNDINPEKTALLKEAYSDYFKKRQISLFSHPLVISVWIVDGQNITHESYYDKNLVNEELNNLSVKDMFKKLALM
ncbi:MAG: DEAD/DEAH box helicase family protein [Acholeplasmatales bacterium]|nr:DEAD/DEAH box helicase family protein [Acholeplasmatales bacterium]